MAEPHKRRLRTDVQQFLKSSNQFLRDYGEFMSEWAMFEMILEVKIAQLANLEPRDASIIIGGLSFGNKPPILYSLLSARRRTAAIPKVKAVINHAKRNALVHSAVTGRFSPTSFAFFKREIGDRMKVTGLRFSAKQFNEHLLELKKLRREAMKALRVHGPDVEAYAQMAGLYRPTRKRPQAPRRGAVRRK